MATPAFQINGRDFPIVPMDEWNLGEINDAERFFGVEYGKAGASLIIAVIYVSMHRVDTRVTVDTVRALPNKTILELADLFNAIEDEAVDASPPEPGERPSEPLGSSPTNGDEPSGLSELDRSLTGDGGSEHTSISDPMISPV